MKSMFEIATDLGMQAYEAENPQAEVIDEVQDQPIDVAEPTVPDAQPKETFALPEYLSDEWKPKQFEDAGQEVEWYRENYAKVINMFQNDEFLEQVSSSLKKEALGDMEDFEQFIDHYRGFKSNPKEYIRQYFPDKMAELGIEPVWTDDEMSDILEKQLEEEFGEDYYVKYNIQDTIKPKSFSARVLNRSRQLQDELERKNEANRAMVSNYQKTIKPPDGTSTPPANEIDEQELLENQYKEHFSSWNKNDFSILVNEIKNKTWNLSDFEKVVNFNRYLEQAKEEGRKQALNEIKGNGRTVKPTVEAAPSNEQSRGKINQAKSIYELIGH